MYYLNDYREGQKLVGTYLCKSKQILKTKAGKTYYSLILQDKTGTADAKIWELGRGIEDFETMDYIYCEGLVTSFQGNIQMNISRVRRSEEGEYDPADYIPTTDKDIKEMYAKVVAYVNSVKNPYLSKLLKMFFVEDKEFVKEFCNNKYYRKSRYHNAERCAKSTEKTSCLHADVRRNVYRKGTRRAFADCNNVDDLLLC